jgi:hypothetical protein
VGQTGTVVIGKTKEFRVFNKRFQFTCPFCAAKRSFFISNLRRKNIKCFNCGESIRCLFNRRTDKRNYQSGKIILTTRAGRDLEVYLKDLSFRGAGVEVPAGVPLGFLSVGEEVSLKCTWNSQLITNRRFVIQNIKGQQIGVKKAYRS